MKQSVYMVIGLIVALSVWLLSGVLEQHADTPSELSSGVAERPEIRTTVRVRQQQARPFTREIVLNGHTAPVRTVTLRAETTGRITQVGASRGASVQQGDVIARLTLDDRTARLEQARAMVRQRQREYDATRALGTRGYVAALEVEKAVAALEAARADLKRIEVEATNTTIRAPFPGVLHERAVEVGDYVAPGTAVATLVDTSTLLVIGNVAQQHISELNIGGQGTARLITGQEVKGTIRYVAATADMDTRTFTIELAVPNPHGTLAAGVSSEIFLPVATLAAHLVSPAFLVLDDAGTLGVKAVNNNDIVVFYPAQIVRADTQGVWLAGLPPTIRLITVGQGFVSPGERVQPMAEETVGTASPQDRTPDTPGSHPSS